VACVCFVCLQVNTWIQDIEVIELFYVFFMFFNSFWALCFDYNWWSSFVMTFFIRFGNGEGFDSPKMPSTNYDRGPYVFFFCIKKG
jgi:hypothetical protein